MRCGRGLIGSVQSNTVSGTLKICRKMLEEMPFAEVRGSKCDRGGDSGVYKGFSEFT